MEGENYLYLSLKKIKFICKNILKFVYFILYVITCSSSSCHVSFLWMLVLLLGFSHTLHWASQAEMFVKWATNGSRTRFNNVSAVLPLLHSSFLDKFLEVFIVLLISQF